MQILSGTENNFNLNLPRQKLTDTRLQTQRKGLIVSGVDPRRTRRGMLIRIPDQVTERITSVEDVEF